MVELKPGLRREIFDGIVERITTMPASLREAFVLRHYDGHSELQIAKIMGISSAQVHDMLHEAEDLIYSRMHILRPPLEEDEYYDPD